jgi:hypothetical protein
MTGSDIEDLIARLLNTAALNQIAGTGGRNAAEAAQVISSLRAENEIALETVISRLTDVQLRHIAESKDTGSCRSRIRSAIRETRSVLAARGTK